MLIVDGVGDTLKTLRLAVDSVRRLCDGTDFLPPAGVIACVAVLKQGAAKVEVPGFSRSLAYPSPAIRIIFRKTVLKTL